MQFQPSPDQEGFIRQAMDSGRLRHPEQALAEAMALWEVRERQRAELLADLDAADAAVARRRARLAAETATAA